MFVKKRRTCMFIHGGENPDVVDLPTLPFWVKVFLSYLLSSE